MAEVERVYADELYVVSSAIWEHVDSKFEWERSFMSPPSNAIFGTQEIGDDSIKHTMYAMCRNSAFKNLAKYSDGRKSVLSIRKSTIEGAGLGCFSERRFNAGDIISIYMGKIMLPGKKTNHNTKFLLMAVSQLMPKGIICI